MSHAMRGLWVLVLAGRVAAEPLPTGLALDAAARKIYVADTRSGVVRLIDLGDLGGEPRTVWPLDASKVSPSALALDGRGGLYVADSVHETIHRVDLASGQSIVAAADEAVPSVRLHKVMAITVAADGLVYFADTLHHVIRRLHPATRAVTVVAGTWNRAGDSDGVARTASFNWPSGLVADQAGHLYVCDWKSGRVRRITLSDGKVETLAKGLKSPVGLALSDKHLYIFDGGSHQIRSLDLLDNKLTITARGVAHTLTDSFGESPAGLAADGDTLYFVGGGAELVRKLSLKTGAAQPLR